VWQQYFGQGSTSGASLIVEKDVKRMPADDLKSVDSHFEFGKNWASYAQLIGDPEIGEAKNGLLKLVPAEDLAGGSFLDIGCGSGLHALAAAQLGVSRVLAVDIDADSVGVTKELLAQHNLSIPWRAEQISAFALDPLTHGAFDIVYSWGVLHHTGSMREAIRKAATLTKPGGLFAFALYRSTKLDWFWVREKRWYARAPAALQKATRAVYITLFVGCFSLLHGSFMDYVSNYRARTRGMDWFHDVHDWLGGYPYETICAPEVETLMRELGFEPFRVFSKPVHLGLFGSGCDEYVYRKHSTK
jgi:2-polyprenyl-3-methyl-5-hydroxy-6-metoxy-1,4-benzoquinol methylase